MGSPRSSSASVGTAAQGFDEYDLLHADSDADIEDDDGIDVQISSSSTNYNRNISRRGNHKRNMSWSGWRQIKSEASTFHSRQLNEKRQTRLRRSRWKASSHSICGCSTLVFDYFIKKHNSHFNDGKESFRNKASSIRISSQHLKLVVQRLMENRRCSEYLRETAKVVDKPRSARILEAVPKEGFGDCAHYSALRKTTNRRM